MTKLFKLFIEIRLSLGIVTCIDYDTELNLEFLVIFCHVTGMIAGLMTFYACSNFFVVDLNCKHYIL